MVFENLSISDENGIREMSDMATEIVREHFDPIIGKAQNDYMIARFQTADAIRDQLKNGYEYYFVSFDDQRIGFLAFYPKKKWNTMYLSKFYLYKSERGKGYSRQMLDFVIARTRENKLSFIELNVNRNNSAILAYEKLGFEAIRSEKNDIGSGFFMDDYVYCLKVS